MSPAVDTQSSPPAAPGEQAPDHGWRDRLRYLSFSRISAVYVFAALFLLFVIWIPDTFLTKTTWIDIASSQAITSILTLGLLFPLAAGAYDLSIGQTLGISSVLSAYLTTHGVDVPTAVILSLLAGVLIGLVNATLVVILGISSFIATLGTSSVLLAFSGLITHQEQIIGIPEALSTLGTTQIFEIPIPFFYLLGLAVVAWYALEHTPFGRYLYAIGGGPEAARLAGVRTKTYVFAALTICAVVAAFAGVILTGTLSAGSPGVGGSYLLPAYAAAFLGATQIKPGRFNVLGALLAGYLLATGVKGLQLAGAESWVTEMFNGVVLILAVAFSRLEGRLTLWSRRDTNRGADDAAVEEPPKS
jgi:ribose transport system permease protein